MNITFTPTPRLDYTMRYNEAVELRRIQRAESVRESQELEDQKLMDHQQKVRMEENYRYSKMIEEMNLYNNLSQKKAYNDYKYAYWVGTLIDQYI